jgi:hypothetical protein
MTTPETLSEGIDLLRKQGYTEDFNLVQGGLECRSGEIRLSESDFEVDSVFRFEGMTDPADETALYAISSNKEKMKGTLVNGYGIYSEPITDKVLEKLHYSLKR